MLQILFFSVIIMLASLSGGLFVLGGVGKFLEKNLHFLVSFSAGVFLVITFNLGEETLAEAVNTNTALMWIIIGMFSIWLVFKLLPDFHHHHDREGCDHSHSGVDIRKILLGDGIHNIADGILLTASFVVSSTLGILTTVGILIHEIIQGVSQFFVMKEAGHDTKKALKKNFATSSTILIGSIGSFFLLKEFSALEVPLLGIATGVFLIIVFQDLIPHSLKNFKNGKMHALRHVGWFVAGLVVMYLVSGAVGH